MATPKNYTAPLQLPQTPHMDALKVELSKIKKIEQIIADLKAANSKLETEKSQIENDQTGDPGELAKQAADLARQIAENEFQIKIWQGRLPAAAVALQKAAELAAHEDYMVTDRAFADHRQQTLDNLLNSEIAAQGAEIMKAAGELSDRESVLEHFDLAKRDMESNRYSVELEKLCPGYQFNLENVTAPEVRQAAGLANQYRTDKQ